ncbi:MAG: GntR family transcriptional regulator [Anaerococcus sp.]|nr:GntR family transcriptional regulator [Anaerococcus sp.]
MFLNIDFSSELPIYEQIRRQIILALARGDIDYGYELPSVRNLAADIGVNLHTVNKAYKLLEEDGIIEIDRRRGSKIVDKSLPIKEEKREDIFENLDFLISLSKLKGINKEEMISLVEKIYGF